MAKGHVKTKNGRYKINRIYINYKQNLESLRIFAENLTPIVKRHDSTLTDQTERAAKHLLRILKGGKSIFKKKNKKKNGKTELQLSGRKFRQLMDCFKEFPRAPVGNTDILYKSLFIMLICHFDFLFSDLLHRFYQQFPQSLTGKELTLSLRELESCESIKDAYESIVDKEVEKVLYKSLSEGKRHFKEFLKIDCKANIVNWNVIADKM